MRCYRCRKRYPDQKRLPGLHSISRQGGPRRACQTPVNIVSMETAVWIQLDHCR